MAPYGGVPGGSEKRAQTVPTGRVIKYPKKCALFCPPGGSPPGGPKSAPPDGPPGRGVRPPLGNTNTYIIAPDWGPRRGLPGGAPGGARGRPGTPRRGLPGTPQNGPFLGPIYTIFYITDPPFWGSPPGCTFGPPGARDPRGAKKCTFFWVFNNSPSRDSLGTPRGTPRDGAILGVSRG